jgi:hypothetical protein
VPDTTDGAMDLDPNFLEFIELLDEHDARFLVVGGYAVALHGHPRYTADLDVWVWLDQNNADAVMAALHGFGFGDTDLAREDVLQEDRVVQLGYPPLRIDLLTSLDGVEFADCYERRVIIDVQGVEVPFIGLEDLRRNKRAAGRHQDLADLEALNDGRSSPGS